jgi:hypothetical protein
MRAAELENVDCGSHITFIPTSAHCRTVVAAEAKGMFQECLVTYGSGHQPRHREDRQRDTGRNGRSFASGRSSRELRGFGAFSVKLREARQGRNPRTGAGITPIRARLQQGFAINEMGFRHQSCTAAIVKRECPLWVKSGHGQMSDRCPLYSQKRTLPGDSWMSALCQKRTRALQQCRALFSAGAVKVRAGCAACFIVAD